MAMSVPAQIFVYGLTARLTVELRFVLQERITQHRQRQRLVALLQDLACEIAGRDARVDELRLLLNGGPTTIDSLLYLYHQEHLSRLHSGTVPQHSR